MNLCSRLLAVAALASCALATTTRAQYCGAGSTSCNPAPVPNGDERISHVIFGTIDHVFDIQNVPAGCYTNLSSTDVTTVDPGSQYQLVIYYANAYSPDQGGAWIDWNRNQVFDPSEQIALTRIVDSPAYFTASVTVPPNAAPGVSRLRVVVQYGGTPAPCATVSYGEVQDYGVTINTPAVGACCAGIGCAISTQGACAGTYLGTATTCTPANLCAGLCCMPGSGACTLTTSTTCTGGSFGGAGSTCEPVNPCGGACCSGGACTVTLASGCPSPSVFVSGRVCSATACVYCDAGSNSCASTSGFERVGRVVFNTIDNDSGVSDDPSGCYNDYTFLSTTLTQGQTYSITVYDPNGYSGGGDQCVVWVDWNRDFAFGNAASGEQVVLSSSDLFLTWTGTVTVPSNASVGSTRMRVRVMWTGTPSPCGNATYGEVEDYSVVVAAATNGACCTASGACSVTSSGSCSGVHQGLGTTCTPSNPCGGACCTSTGACSVTTAASCQGGSSFINQGVCGPNACDGACCDSGGNCTVVPTAAACAGTFSGAGTACLPSPCPGQSCSSAIPLALGVEVPGSLADSVATSSISCSVGTHGLWYSFTAPSTNTYVFRSLLTSNADTAVPTLALFGACGTQIDCQAASYQVLSIQAMTAGQTYRFRAGALNDVLHTYTASVHVPVYGACCHPVTGFCATSSVGSDGCVNGATYMGNGTTCSPTLCGQGACCHGPTALCKLSTAAGCAAPYQFQSVGLTCSPNPCPIPPQTNYDCATATALALNVAVQGNSSLDPGDGTEGPGGSCFFGSPDNFSHGVWFRFTPAVTTDYLVSSCGSTFDTSMAIFSVSGSPACDNLAELACDDDSCIGGTSDNPMPGPGPGNIYTSLISSVNLTAGSTYYIRLAAWSTGGAGGAYGMVVRYASSVTLGTCCVGANCSITEPFECTGTFTAGAACSSNPCVAGGTCCRGATCSTAFATAATCSASLSPGTLAGAAFVSTAACNAGGSAVSPCCYANYNKDASITVQDIFDFLGDWFAGRKTSLVGGDGDTGTLAVQSIFDFLNAWFAGGC